MSQGVGATTYSAFIPPPLPPDPPLVIDVNRVFVYKEYLDILNRDVAH
jgi:hypothetical protein